MHYRQNEGMTVTFRAYTYFPFSEGGSLVAKQNAVNLPIAIFNNSEKSEVHY